MQEKIPQEMIDYLKPHIDSRVHCTEETDSSSQLLYAMDLAKRIYYCVIELPGDGTPNVFVVNDKQAAGKAVHENLGLAIATACAISYGWVDPNV